MTDAPPPLVASDRSIGFVGNAFSQSTHSPYGAEKGSARRKKYQHGAQKNRIGQRLYHQSLPYQLKN